MSKANKILHPETREKLTSSVLHLLASLPEAHRNIFVWKHYYGWPESQIASRLGWSSAEVENILLEISRSVIQTAEVILLESAQLEESGQLRQGFSSSILNEESCFRWVTSTFVKSMSA